MNDINEEDLLLYHYGELSEGETTKIQTLLETNQALQAQYDEIVLLLNATNDWKPGTIDEDFEQHTWQTIESEIKTIKNSQRNDVRDNSISLWQRFSSWLFSNNYQLASAFALLLTVVSIAYFTGRYDQQQNMIDDPSELLASLSADTREQILFRSVATHMERSSRLLTTVSMDTSLNTKVAMTEQKWARQLLMSNRLFSNAAKQSGQWRIVSLLNELEPILLEMANSSKNTLANREQIKERISNQKLIFKTKIFKTEANNLI